ncbi:MAG: acyl-CoA thioester hydrolase/BAAT C-terminal domain-containing protein [Flavicella sp.]
MKKKNLAFIGILLLLVVAYFIADKRLYDGIKPQMIRENGFRVNLYVKEGILDTTTIILVGGGAWGDYWAQEFSKKGKVGVSIPYVGETGMPKLVEAFPLDYFEKALQWLSKRQEVNAEKIVVMGASRNAELALLLASKFPNYISGVIAYSPSAVSWSNTVLPYSSDTVKPSWTFKNVAIPYVPMDKIKGSQTDSIVLLDYWNAGLRKTHFVEKAIIKVERIKGDVLLFSGKEDGVWPAAKMADMLEKRAVSYDFSYSLQNIQYDEAGHLISGNPNQQGNSRNGMLYIDRKSYSYVFGGTDVGDYKAKKDAEKKVYEFLENL